MVRLTRSSHEIDDLVQHGVDRLANGGQSVRRPGCHGDVVKADDREIERDVEPEFTTRRIHETHCQNVVGAEHRLGGAEPASNRCAAAYPAS